MKKELSEKTKIAKLDHRLSILLFKTTTKNDALHKIAVIFARWVLWLLLIGITLTVFLRKDPIHVTQLAELMSITLVIAITTNLILGAIFIRNRPFATHELHPLIPTRWLKGSFPSDHAMLSLAIATPLLITDPITGIWAVAIALTIAISRVAVGVHYLSDVTVGSLIGIFSSIIAMNIIN